MPSPGENSDAATLPVLWGAVSGREERSVGHCCFTSLEASPLVEGGIHARMDAEENSNGHGYKAQQDCRMRRGSKGTFDCLTA